MKTADSRCRPKRKFNQDLKKKKQMAHQSYKLKLLVACYKSIGLDWIGLFSFSNILGLSHTECDSKSYKL